MWTVPDGPGNGPTRLSTMWPIGYPLKSVRLVTMADRWNGIIDEVRISDTARDACWIETEYNNQ